MNDDSINEIKIKELTKALLMVNKELLFQNEEKAKRAAELLIADKELVIQNQEKALRAAELLIANKELAFQNEEKAKRAAELLIANKELLFQKSQKEKRAAELVIADKELIIQNHEKSLRSAELLIARNKINTQEEIIKIQKALFIEKQLFEKTLLSIGDAVISMDTKKKIIFLNKVAETVTGWTQEEAFGKPIYEVFSIFDELTREKKEDIVKKVMRDGKIHQIANHTILIRKDKKELLIEDSAAPILNEEGEVVGVVIVFRDYTEKWERLKKIEHISYHDELTGLYNRRFYEDEIKRFDNIKNLPISLIMGDVNGLKLINDSFGHEVGDKLLKTVANAIMTGCRTDDLVARLGGDEFVIALPNSSAIETEKVIQRIKNNLLNEKVFGIDVSISFGFDIKTNENQDIRTIFKNTEDQMYRQKIYESSSMRSKQSM